jgi:hypothetical protein
LTVDLHPVRVLVALARTCPLTTIGRISSGWSGCSSGDWIRYRGAARTPVVRQHCRSCGGAGAARFLTIHLHPGGVLVTLARGRPVTAVLCVACGACVASASSGACRLTVARCSGPATLVRKRHEAGNRLVIQRDARRASRHTVAAIAR